VTIPLIRSKLFVPGSRPELFEKAFVSHADAISIDLEDAVPDASKASARLDVVRFLGSAARTGKKSIVIRINQLRSPYFEADLEALVGLDFDIVNLPKAESAADISVLAGLIDELEKRRDHCRPLRILANIESPRGLRFAADIALASPRVMGLQIGYGDLFEPLGIGRRHAGALEHVQLAVRFAAAEAGVAAYDGAFPDIGDKQGFLEEARRAKALGFQGKSCIHPVQIAAANEAFQPSGSEVAFSRKVVKAWHEAAIVGRGAIVVDGIMIDAPYAAKAEAVLLEAQRFAAMQDVEA
jgi:citrate lyase subunit beta / citryl-CoA lyase